MDMITMRVLEFWGDDERGGKQEQAAEPSFYDDGTVDGGRAPQMRRRKRGGGPVKIEKNIPVPSRKGRPVSPAAELMMEMKTGDSIGLRKSMAGATQLAVKYIGKGRYACRAEGNGTRVWRIK